MVWKKKTAFITVHIQFRESIFWLPHNPDKSNLFILADNKAWINTGRSAGATIHLWKKRSGT